MRKSILTILLFSLLFSCHTQPTKEVNKQNNSEMEKKNIGSQTALYPKALTDIGAAARERDLEQQPIMCAKEPMGPDGIVRLSKIKVYPQYLGKYLKYATEVGEISLRTEPGVLTMYAIGEKENPCKITILETYASKEAYDKHIASEHFQKYKQGTQHMVKSLVLSDQIPLNPANQINNFIK